ncbi:hypothetical protein [Pseudomonas phage 98PfluR60PP]|uniref:Uncharacterized protein n=1 Tax=Pseudomonas phage 98PfluR60PP TaxID=2163965 RepID=A0A2S1PFW0_9CAUD|nr:hypothetical protein PP760_gp27 [Pseudomonas phage 98PfluR60PP]AWH15459.1 hypothetical protein [Pseudomonas phage 98PfluR60PP]
MSTAGMQIFLDAGGDVQIDDRYFNLAFVSKTVLSLGSPSGSGPSGYMTVSGLTMPMVAFTGGPAALHSMSSSNGTFKINFISQYPVTITVYLFDVPTSSGISGCQVFNDNGELTFDSSRKYMKVKYEKVFTNLQEMGGDGGGVANHVMPVGPQYAVLQSSFAGFRYCEDLIPGESGPIYSYTTIQWVMYNVSGNVLQSRILQVFGNQTGNVPPWQASVYAGRVQTIDVTGL